MADVIRPSEQYRDALETPARRPRPWRQWAIYAVLIAGAVLAVIPFLWMVSWSLMTNAEVTVGRVIPAQVMWVNYETAWNQSNFSLFMWNSARITAITISGLMLFCIPAAYAFARMRFWGRNVLFAIMLATLMIPDIVTLIPNFLTVVWIGRLSESLFGPAGAWLNNWPSLTIPFMASAFSIFLLRQFFAQIPDELWDAARIDGAGHLLFLVRVIVPLSKPAIMTVVTFAFIGSWNSLLWPLLVRFRPTSGVRWPLA
ncbi:MAG: carbohydrate ABC transporter permease [Anaerolineae bacterium]|nr:carbohydrate ABC transporter permease [Anaerolineae bacterium]